MRDKLKISKGEIIIKSCIVGVIFILLLISFLFDDKIENLLSINRKFLENEVSLKEISQSNYKVSYLDVGQGNSTLVELPDGKTLLIDGGTIDNGEKLVDLINGKGISVIDYMIATHADIDHFGGLISVLENFEVKTIYRPFQIAGSGTTYETFVPSDFEDLKDVYSLICGESGKNSMVSRVTLPEYEMFISKIYSEFYTASGEMIASEIIVFYDGLVISGEGYSVEFYCPQRRESEINLINYSKTNGYATVGYGASNSNNNSAIFLLEVGTEKFLFTGDAPYSDSSNSGKYEEMDFINSLNDSEKIKLSHVSVYLAGHHGSNYSSSPELLEIIKPDYTIFSVAKDNIYGFPKIEVMDRLLNANSNSKYFITYSEGNIIFGNIEGQFVYNLSNREINNNYNVSWKLLGFIIFSFLSVLIFSIKWKKYNC